MKHLKQAGVKALDGSITASEHGGFLAVASTGNVDRDGEIIKPGALNPLPASIPVHLDHLTTARNVVARARPYYVGSELMIEARFGSDAASQEARRKVSEGLVDSVSIVFMAERWEDVRGVRTLTKGELLACDLVTVPSNRDARVLSARSFALRGRGAIADARAVALLAQAAVEISDAKAVLRGATPSDPGPSRYFIDRRLRSILNPGPPKRRSL